MAKKRKSDATGLDEANRTLFSSFCTAAKSISQLYTQAQNHEKTAFHEGERHFVEKLCQWLKDQERASVVVEEILQFLQGELDDTNGDKTMSSPANQSQQIFTHATQEQQDSLLSAPQTGADVMGHSGFGHVSRAPPADQGKAYVFSNALSSPNRRCLSPFISIQGGHASFHSDSAVSLSRRAGSISEQRQHDRGCYIDRCNLNSATSQLSSTIFACDSQIFQTRPHPSGEDDMNMDIHADGNVESPYR